MLEPDGRVPEDSRSSSLRATALQQRYAIKSFNRHVARLDSCGVGMQDKTVVINLPLNLFSGNLIMSAVLKGLSFSQYLDYESTTGEKHEYYRGEVFAMVGGTPRHALIATNFLREASERLKDSRRIAYSGDLRIKVDPSGLYTYPDASVVCGELELDKEVPNTVLNPTILVEVLSDSTESYDRGRKSSHYRRIPSLQALVLISQDRLLVECFTRHESGGWLLTESRQLTESLALGPIGISIPLAELYRNVRFDPAESKAT
jgi:Uma2 family endonuclease